mmetsp:Transcript_35188/g.74333  ORF Transcript_35188/g.74333 Transcript_35188/m.74333 type:complete len:326 (-) Transcript_35188:708-1685(-)
MSVTSFLLSSLVVPVAARLQVDFSVGSHHKLVECRHGTFLINKKDSWVGRSLDVYGEWAQSEVALLSGFIKEGDIVADVGANIGSFTVPMAKMVGTSGKVVAFEPQRVLSQLLSANVALNELANVGVFNAGVGNSDSPLEVPDVIYTDEANFGSISLLVDWKSYGASTTLVPQLKLDGAFADQCPSFIKIDVEGMELMVLDGARQTLTKCHPVLYIENNCKKGSKELIDFASSLGYTCHWHVNPYFSQSNFRENKTDIFPENSNSINMLCFSRDDQVSVRKANEKLHPTTKIDIAGRTLLDEYNLVYTGKDTVLTQLGTMDSCER